MLDMAANKPENHMSHDCDAKPYAANCMTWKTSPIIILCLLPKYLISTTRMAAFKLVKQSIDYELNHI